MSVWLTRGLLLCAVCLCCTGWAVQAVSPSALDDSQTNTHSDELAGPGANVLLEEGMRTEATTQSQARFINKIKSFAKSIKNKVLGFLGLRKDELDELEPKHQMEKEIMQHTYRGMLTCYKRRKVPSWETHIRPNLLHYRDEYIQTIPGASIWLNEGIKKLLTKSKKETKKIAKMFIKHYRNVEDAHDTDILADPAGLEDLLDREFCKASDPCTPDERCLIWHLTILAVLGQDDVNSTPDPGSGEQTYPNARKCGMKQGNNDWCKPPPFHLLKIPGIPMTPLDADLDDELAKPPGMLKKIFNKAKGFLGKVFGFREQLRDELHSTLADMNQRTHLSAAAHGQQSVKVTSALKMHRSLHQAHQQHQDKQAKAPFSPSLAAHLSRAQHRAKQRRKPAAPQDPLTATV